MTDSLEQLARQVGDALEQVMAIEIDRLERLVQAAHECSPYQAHDPDECYGLSRQALRMLWHFRCNLSAIKSVRPTDE